MKKRVLALLLAGAAVASLAACGSSDSGASGSGSAAGGDGEVVELVMGNVTSSSAKDAVTEVLIPKVEEYSNGTLKIVHFPDNQLGNDEQSFAMAQTGECDIAVGSTSSVATTYNDLYVYDVPYLFLNKQEVYDVGFNGETGKAILDGFSEYGLKGLAFWENGFRNITTTDKDIATVADLSGLKIRTMDSQKPPIKVLIPGRVFRSDSDATHSPMFHQMEGLVVDKGITLGDLQGALNTFVQKLFGADTRTRLRPSYFPFTEPSVEVDVSCFECHGKGCPLCKHTGWIEVLGGGVVNRKVLENCNIDPDEYSGFAFGIGIERIAMLKYGINNIGLMFENNLQFLKQFHE